MNRRGFSARLRFGLRGLAALVFAFAWLVTLRAAAQTEDGSGGTGVDYDEYAPSPSPNATLVEDRVRQALRDREFVFCHDPNYVLHKAERPLCPLAASMKERCPEFETTCARPEDLDRGELRHALGGRGGKEKGAAEEKKKKDPIEPVQVPPVVMMIFRLLFWGLVAVLVAVVLYLLFTGLSRNASPREESEDEPETAPEPGTAKFELGVVESDVERLLARAKREAANGDFARAVDDVYAALLRHLEGQQLLVLERFRTNGDYIRALRTHPEWQRLVRDCGRDVERAQFGKQSADVSTFHRLLGRIEPVITRGVAVLLLVCGALLPMGCDGSSPLGSEKKTHWGPLGDRSAVGLSLFAQLLEVNGYEVRHRIRKVSDLDAKVGLLVVYDDTSLEDEDWKALEAWVKKGHELWLAGDVEVAAHFGGARSLTPCEPPFEFGTGFRGDRYLWATADTARPLGFTSLSYQLAEKSDFTPVLTCNGAPMVSQRSVGDGTVTLFPDASFFTNASLLAADDAVVLLALVRAFPMTIEFAGGLTGQGADSPYEALMNAKLGQVLLQIGLFMLVLFLARGIPFAALKDPVDRGRRRFIDHLHALGQLFQRANAPQYALHHYAAWALTKLNERVRPGQRLSVIELGSALAKRTGKSEADVITTLADAASARARAETSSGTDDLQTLKKLESFVIETGVAR